MVKNRKLLDRLYLGDKISPKLRAWIEISPIGLIAIIFLFSESWKIGIALFVLFLYLSPNKKLRNLIDALTTKLVKVAGSLLRLILALLAIGLIIWVISGLFRGIGSLGKYEGLNAEEWFNEYDYAETQIDELQTELFNTQEDLEEAENKIDDIQDDLDKLKSCVESSSYYYYSAEDVYYNCL